MGRCGPQGMSSAVVIWHACSPGSSQKWRKPRPYTWEASGREIGLMQQDDPTTATYVVLRAGTPEFL